MRKTTDSDHDKKDMSKTTDSDHDKKGDEKGMSNLWTQETVDRLFKEAGEPYSPPIQNKDDNDEDKKQKTLDLISRFEVKDIVEHEIVRSPKHVSIMLKFKKKQSPFFIQHSEGKVKDKDLGEGKSKDDKDIGEDMGKYESELWKKTNDELRKMLTGKKGISKLKKEKLVELIISSKSTDIVSD